MTVVVMRDRTMAIDSGLWMGVHLISTTATKIVRTRHGLLGFAGFRGHMEKVRATLEQSVDLPAEVSMAGDTLIFLLANDGTMFSFEAGVCGVIDPPFYAYGDSAPVALGALHHGATAEEACAIAIKVGPYAAGKVLALTLEDK